MSADAGGMSQGGARDGFWLRIIAIVSLTICGAVVFLMTGPRPEGTRGALDVSFLPTVNASLNALTTLLLLVGLSFIKQRRIAQHKRMMLAAFASSSAFLVSYIIYHWFKAEPVRYLGAYRGLYLVILLSHIVLAAVILPLALLTLYRGASMQVAKHRQIAKVTLPLWLYVSVTGVAIYLMLYR
jgi:putative membrane protein